MVKWRLGEGVIVPMITPFDEDGDVDIGAARILAKRLDEAGTIVFILGTTGEGFSIAQSKRQRLVKAVVDELGSGVVIYAGVPGNCLESQVETANRYFELGISAVVAHLPCYYHLSEKEMLDYMGRLADGLDGPLVLYNIPENVGQALPLGVVDELSYRDNVVCLKDTEEDEKRLQKAIALWGRRKDFSYLIGHTPFVVTGLLLGAGGWVPMIGNLVPGVCRSLYAAAERGERGNTERAYRQISEVRAVCRSIPEVKYAASLMGLCGQWVLPPLCGVDDEHKRRIKERLDGLELLD